MLVVILRFTSPFPTNLAYPLKPVKMKTSPTLLVLSFAARALAVDLCSESPCFLGFTEVPGISSLCSDILHPTATVPASVTATIISTIPVTITDYRGTLFFPSTPSPTLFGSCTASTEGSWTTSGTFVVGATAWPTPSTLGVDISEQKVLLAKNQINCPPVAQGISTACSCFYGPATTLTVSATTTVTSYIGQTTHSYTGLPLIRTLAAQCTPISLPIFAAVRFATCGSPGIPVKAFKSCALPVNVTGSEVDHGIITNPLNFIPQDCCSACANTLNCFQSITDPYGNLCILQIRTEEGTNPTDDCPLGHTFAEFSDVTFGINAGFLKGHCAQGCT